MLFIYNPYWDMVYENPNPFSAYNLFTMEDFDIFDILVSY
jgi:hypothetical protein